MGGDIFMKLQTINEMIRNSVNLYGDRTAFKVKKDGKFAPITYKEFYNKVEKFGTGLLGIGIKKLDHVGLVSDNRFEWIKVTHFFNKIKIEAFKERKGLKICKIGNMGYAYNSYCRDFHVFA